MTYRIGVDVGGTFTDLVIMEDGGRTRAHKVLSTPDDPSRAVLAGLAELAGFEGLATGDFIQDIDSIVHGTTVTTNAVLTGRIARTGLLASAGFGWYVKNIAMYSGIYGSLGTMVALMIWMYVAAVIVLIGSEFNAVNERKRHGEASS